MKNVKKIITTTLVFSLLALTVTACGKKETEDGPIGSVNESVDDPQTLTETSTSTEDTSTDEPAKEGEFITGATEDTIKVTIEGETFPLTTSYDDFLKLVDKNGWTADSEIEGGYKGKITTEHGSFNVSFMKNEAGNGREICAISFEANSFSDPSYINVLGVTINTPESDVNAHFPLDEGTPYNTITDYVRFNISYGPISHYIIERTQYQNR